MTVEFYLTRRFGLIFEVVQGKGMHTSHRHICCIVESSFLYYHGFALIFLLAISVQASNQLVGCLVSTYQAGYKIVSWSVCVNSYFFFFFLLFVIDSIAVIHYDIIGCFCVLYMASGRYTTKVDDINWLLWGSFQEGDIKIWSH